MSEVLVESEKKPIVAKPFGEIKEDEDSVYVTLEGPPDVDLECKEAIDIAKEVALKAGKKVRGVHFDPGYNTEPVVENGKTVAYRTTYRLAKDIFG
jgi:hypothetical protein